MQQEFIPIMDDGEILSVSPLTILDTKYYELWLQQVGNSNWSQYTFSSPLPMYQTASPYGSTPCIVISPLPDNTQFNYKVRRWNSLGQCSNWTTGTFTTGVSS
jgi:hypothetical protein